MELMIQTLALAGPRRQRVVALELVGWGDRRALLVRAAALRDLAYLATQIHARYPQCTVRPLTLAEDPFRRAEGEQVLGRLLQPTGAPFLSLRTWAPRPVSRTEHQVGVDPLLGVLATLGPYAPEVRVIVQLALAPAAAAWSTGQQRAADAYSLARMRQEDFARDRGTATHTSRAAWLPWLGLFGVLTVLWWLLQPRTRAARLPFIGPSVRAVQAALVAARHPGASRAASSLSCCRRSPPY